LHLAPGPFLPQHNGPALIETYDVERVLADIDADYDGCGIELLWHDVLLVFKRPLPASTAGRSTAGPSH
jgi:hypothetical protein